MEESISKKNKLDIHEVEVGNFVVKTVDGEAVIYRTTHIDYDKELIVLSELTSYVKKTEVLYVSFEEFNSGKEFYLFVAVEGKVSKKQSGTSSLNKPSGLDMDHFVG